MIRVSPFLFFFTITPLYSKYSFSKIFKRFITQEEDLFYSILVISTFWQSSVAKYITIYYLERKISRDLWKRRKDNHHDTKFEGIEFSVKPLV